MTSRPDNRLDDAAMVPVACGRCGANVEVRKSSWNQTSVQWNAAALQACQERCEAAMLIGRGGGRELFAGCSALRDAIADAAVRGALPIVDEHLCP